MMAPPGKGVPVDGGDGDQGEGHQTSQKPYQAVGEMRSRFRVPGRLGFQPFQVQPVGPDLLVRALNQQRGGAGPGFDLIQ